MIKLKSTAIGLLNPNTVSDQHHNNRGLGDGSPKTFVYDPNGKKQKERPGIPPTP